MISRLTTCATSAIVTIAVMSGFLCPDCIGPVRAAGTDAACGAGVSEGVIDEAPSDCNCVEQQQCDSQQCVPPGCESQGCTEQRCPEQSCPHSGHPWHDWHALHSWKTGHKFLHAICFPCRIIHGVVNFCAHNESVGPPDVQAPGRFHPVPTHPVFAPVAEPVPYPAQQ